MFRSLALSFLVLCPLAAMAVVPGALIVQQDVTKEARAEIVKRITNRPPTREWEPGMIDAKVGSMLASFLDKDGRVFPVVWSLTDAYFRAAVDEGKVNGSMDNPSWADVSDTRPKLKCDYLLLIVAWREGDAVIASLKLYNGRREVWRDDRSMTAQKNGTFDLPTALESLASTWSQLLADGPLKALPRQRSKPQEDPGAGQKPPQQDNPNVGGAKPPPNNEAVELAMKKLAAGQPYAAMNLLRDAVDAEPLEPERRKLLVSVLQQVSEFTLAAEEARRAAGLFPARSEFRVLAARAWLQAKNSEEALKDLNEAVAHDPDAYETRLLLGDLQLEQLRFAFAKEHFDKAIGKNPTADALYSRGLARAFLGDVQGAKDDWGEAGRLSPSIDSAKALSRFRLAATLALGFGESASAEIRAVLPLARSNAKDPATAAAVAEVARKAGTLSAVLATLAPPPPHTRSFQRLVLASKLLIQSVSEAQALLATPSDDLMSEASITLGEALKQLKDARTAFDSEK